MLTIVERSDKLQNACSEHFAIKHLKNYGLKIRGFLKEDQKLHSKLNDAKESSDNQAINKQVEETIKRDNNDDIETSTAKRVKYESPLDFQKDATISEDKYETKEKVLIQFFLPFELRLLFKNYFSQLINK